MPAAPDAQGRQGVHHALRSLQERSQVQLPLTTQVALAARPLQEQIDHRRRVSRKIELFSPKRHLHFATRASHRLRQPSHQVRTMLAEEQPQLLIDSLQLLRRIPHCFVVSTLGTTDCRIARLSCPLDTRLAFLASRQKLIKLRYPLTLTPTHGRIRCCHKASPLSFS